MDKTTTQELLAQAEKLCAQRNVRLTPQRLEVLRLMTIQPGAISAYDLLDLLRESEPQAKPPTVYRALDFLLEHGLIHRIERLSAFVPCTHLQQDHPHDHSHGPAENCLHSAQFLICRSCGGVTEIADAPRVLDVLKSICGKKNFTMQSASVEVEGVCEDCAPATRCQKGPAPAPN